MCIRDRSKGDFTLACNNDFADISETNATRVVVRGTPGSGDTNDVGHNFPVICGNIRYKVPQVRQELDDVVPVFADAPLVDVFLDYSVDVQYQRIKLGKVKGCKKIQPIQE
eukprot:TRINITY_DN2589_c0_g1_i1.p1 TRINITY_DN2589_c0_g1~~TRINITY_DN2589_c0_g1_i1.p1  ORF type:complete len:111 (-),score=8.21 TRINITY_DN2589_c0_g1_i1:180-512(-)